MRTRITVFLLGIMLTGLFTGCGIYKFNDASIDPRIKTIKINFIENKARFVNPQAAQKFYDKIQQKIVGNTKLTRTNDDNAHYVLSGTITTYDGTQTVGISGQQASSNRFTVALHFVWRQNIDNKTEEFDVTRSLDYPASSSFEQAQASLLDDMVKSLTDDIFNRMFSNW